MVYSVRILCFFLISSLVSGQNISGTWNWSFKEKHQSTITLKEIGPTKYKGNYCSVLFNGMKKDCNEDKSNGILLSITSQNTFTGTFECSFSYSSGTLELEYLPNTNSLKLNILKEPEGEYYFPNDVLFQRD